MPTKKYAMEKGEPKRLEISWKGIWKIKNFTVHLDGNNIGLIANRKELKAGREFALIDGSILKVQLVKKLLSAELRVLRDGQPLPGSASDPGQRLRVAYGIVFFIGGVTIGLGLITELLQVGFLQQVGFGFDSIIYGGFFLLLGFFVKRRSMLALGIAVGLFVLDGILSVVLFAQQGGTPPVGVIVARIILLIPMIRGFGAIRALKRGAARKPIVKILLIGCGTTTVLAIFLAVWLGYIFLKDIFSNMNVHIEDLETGNIITITTEGWNGGPTFSPDGQKILFQQRLTEEDNHRIKIYSMQNQTSSVVIEDGHMPIWGPLGQTILYISKGEGQPDIWEYSLQDDVTRRVTQDEAEEISPKISNDGKWLLFLHETPETGEEEIFIMPIEGGTKVPLIKRKHELEEPIWAPNSKEIAYISFLSLIIMNTDGVVVKEIDLTGFYSFTDLIFHPTDPDTLILRASSTSTPFIVNLYKISRVSGSIEVWKADFWYLIFFCDISPNGKLMTYSK